MKGLLNQILGQEQAIAEIQRRLSQQSLRGSFLFSGPDGVGKKTTAFAIAAALLGSEAPITTGTHPDLLTLAPDDKETIKIDAAREMIRRLHSKPVLGDRMIAIIDRCETLTTEASNALLKSVEEHNGTFILITSRPGSLLPTLRSRCQILHFRPLPTETMRELLTGDLSAKQIERVLPIAGGSLSQARHCAAWLEDMEISLPALFREFATEPYTRLENRLRELPSDPQGIAFLLAGLRGVGRDLLLLANQCDIQKIIFAESQQLFSELGGNVDDFLQCLSAIDEAERAIRQRTSALLLWETLAFSFKKVLKEIHAA